MLSVRVLIPHEKAAFSELYKMRLLERLLLIKAKTVSVSVETSKDLKDDDIAVSYFADGARIMDYLTCNDAESIQNETGLKKEYAGLLHYALRKLVYDAIKNK